ncbi:hypothetical protein E4U13_002787 [Claviceps humidiphila]|uniref:Uncharacterized protein n=1 Tax=Claviceps humidiphila TaxID=1294629 RepID=A0A9P7Q153_9HYPO|nr:hypothetical protein E4U13_002787 [Claviceps humidiphila]
MPRELNGLWTLTPERNVETVSPEATEERERVPKHLRADIDIIARLVHTDYERGSHVPRVQTAFGTEAAVNRRVFSVARRSPSAKTPTDLSAKPIATPTTCADFNHGPKYTLAQVFKRHYMGKSYWTCVLNGDSPACPNKEDHVRLCRLPGHPTC